MPAKPKELKFSVDKDRRSLILIANFIDGYTSDYKFTLPESFRDALDIKRTPRTIFGKEENIYTQGRNYSFQDGDIIYNSKSAYLSEWGNALKDIQYTIQIISAKDAASEPEEILNQDNIIITKYNYDPGFIKFRLLKTNDAKTSLLEEIVYECTQENFIVCLQCGILRTLDSKTIKIL